MEAQGVISESTDAEVTLGYKGHEERVTPELVFVFVEPIGGGARQVADLLGHLLEAPAYAYKVNPISVSSIIEAEYKKLSLSDPPLHNRLKALQNISDEALRINKLQQLGNTLREKKGPDYLARKIIQKIFEYRVQNNGLESPTPGLAVAKPMRFAHIIKSLKNKSELSLLKAVYGPMLVVVAVSGSYEQHVANYKPLRDGEQHNEQIKKEYDLLALIDQDEGVDHGQQVREIFYRANLFVNSDKENAKSRIDQFLSLLFSTRIGCPSCDERMMFEAFSASLRSTCLSRQVGAALADERGELVSVGWNDVPAYRGGLSVDSDGTSSQALCKYKTFCRSDAEKDDLLEVAYVTLTDGRLLKKGTKKEDLRMALQPAIVGGLIEFSRAIHAEMETILSAARTGRIGLRGGVLYVTTYPCDNCVKHILAVGIRRVVYIEPYPKSRAKAFFSDLIQDDVGERNDPNKLTLSQFVGLAPESYALLYKKIGNRKLKSGKLIEPPRRPMPRTGVYLDGFALYEGHIAKGATDEE